MSSIRHMASAFCALTALVWISAILSATAQVAPAQIHVPLLESVPTTNASNLPDEPWAALPTDKWPQILLRNSITIRGFTAWSGGGAFLMHAPTGQLVGLTCSAGLVQGIKYDALNTSVASWYLFPPNQPSLRIGMRHFAMPTDPAVDVDYVAMTVQPGKPPAELLTPTTQPLQLHQTIYAVGLPDTETNVAQHVYKAVVYNLNHTLPGEIAYQFTADIAPNSLHGGPLLDEWGHVVGIQGTYYPEPTWENHIVGEGMQITKILDRIVPVPGDNSAQPAAPVERRATTLPATVPVRSIPPTIAEDPSARSLRVARMYESSGQPTIARKKLDEIIKNYPGTSAAKDAQADLDRLPK